jgi:thiamine-monophosphate kinase
MALSEFDLIARYFSRSAGRTPGVVLGVGDDAAVVDVPPGQSLVMSMDTLVAGVHFPDGASADAVGHKALAVNLSDMAAMGATPNWLLLGLTLPQAEETWLADFSRGLHALADEYGLALIGGDTTRGPLTVTVQVNGLVPQGGALLRSGARSGDLIYVSGQLGDAGLGLKLELQQLDLELPAARRDYFIQRLQRPTPRLALGLALRGVASAAIDISDGLLADLGHILDAGKVGAVVEVDQLPVAEEVRGLAETWWSLPLCAGDDYELCFTIPPERQALLEERLQSIDVPCHCIGRIELNHGLKLLHHGREIETQTLKGYLHFE